VQQKKPPAPDTTTTAGLRDDDPDEEAPAGSKTDSHSPITQIGALGSSSPRRDATPSLVVQTGFTVSPTAPTHTVVVAGHDPQQRSPVQDTEEQPAPSGTGQVLATNNESDEGDTNVRPPHPSPSALPADAGGSLSEKASEEKTPAVTEDATESGATHLLTANSASEPDAVAAVLLPTSKGVSEKVGGEVTLTVPADATECEVADVVLAKVAAETDAAVVPCAAGAVGSTPTEHRERPLLIVDKEDTNDYPVGDNQSDTSVDVSTDCNSEAIIDEAPVVVPCEDADRHANGNVADAEVTVTAHGATNDASVGAPLEINDGVATGTIADALAADPEDNSESTTNPEDDGTTEHPPNLAGNNPVESVRTAREGESTTTPPPLRRHELCTVIAGFDATLVRRVMKEWFHANVLVEHVLSYFTDEDIRKMVNKHLLVAGTCTDVQSPARSPPTGGNAVLFSAPTSNLLEHTLPEVPVGSPDELSTWKVAPPPPRSPSTATTEPALVEPLTPAEAGGAEKPNSKRGKKRNTSRDPVCMEITVTRRAFCEALGVETKVNKDKKVCVALVRPGTPAARSKLFVGMIIQKVQGIPVEVSEDETTGEFIHNLDLLTKDLLKVQLQVQWTSDMIQKRTIEPLTNTPFYHCERHQKPAPDFEAYTKQHLEHYLAPGKVLDGNTCSGFPVRRDGITKKPLLQPDFQDDNGSWVLGQRMRAACRTQPRDFGKGCKQADDICFRACFQCVQDLKSGDIESEEVTVLCHGCYSESFVDAVPARRGCPRPKHKK
jgi:hypothetical protein